jgi:exopolysaccharide biosynthesis protein
VLGGERVVNLVTIDLKKGGRLRTYKGLDAYDGLEAVRNIYQRAESALDDTVLVATNGSFWRAGYNSPIGATVANGEAVEMPGYKGWSSLVIHDDGTAHIDRITLRGELVWRGEHLPVAAVNRRLDEEGIVVYNHYYGEGVPRGSRKSDSAIIAEVLGSRITPEQGDDTEQPATTDTAAILRDYRQAKAREDREHAPLKFACALVPSRRKRDPLPLPTVGTPMQLVVVKADTGSLRMPENGFIISPGSMSQSLSGLHAGDTIALSFTVTPGVPGGVRDLITGTPRLIRDGVADPEYEIEGSHAARFVRGELSRTSVGISRGGDTLFLATVDSPDRAAGTTGMTLSQIATFLRSVGAYQAMNFDGGGSATMVIGGETISRQGGRPFNRRVSNAILVVKTAGAKQGSKRGRP